LTQQWGHTFRRLQVATKWSVEALLYPVYVLFHLTETSGKTLHTTEPQSRPQLQPNDTDTPIQRVLEAVNNLPSVKDDTADITSEPFQPLIFLGSWRQKFFHQNQSLANNTNIPQSLTVLDNSAESLNHYLPWVRGIASNLVNRNLVLVSTNNETLDILTPQQQAQLTDRIISEVANYWHSWQLSQARKQRELLPEIDRLLAKLTDGSLTKTSSLNQEAIAANNLKYQLLSFLDIAVAKLESNAIIPVQQGSQQIVQIAQTQLNIFLYGKKKLANKGEIAVNTDNLETHVLDFQALIEAALNYFFGVSPEQKLPSKPHVLLKNYQSQNHNLVADSWLQLDDLFGESDTNIDKLITSSQRVSPTLVHTLEDISQPRTRSRLVQKQKPSRGLTSTQKTSTKITSLQQTQGEISQQLHQNTQIESKPDWIETKAMSMGYDKHPLERILEWLDYVMLWLEERFVKIFQLLQRLWSDN
jgi:hypothetical protein